MADRIYFITDGQNYKIGCSKHPERTLKHLQTIAQKELWVAYEHTTKFGKRHKKTLHRYFNKNRIGQGWFCLCETDVENIKNICEKVENGFSVLEIYMQTYIEETLLRYCESNDTKI